MATYHVVIKIETDDPVASENLTTAMFEIGWVFPVYLEDNEYTNASVVSLDVFTKAP